MVSNNIQSVQEAQTRLRAPFAVNILDRVRDESSRVNDLVIGEPQGL